MSSSPVIFLLVGSLALKLKLTLGRKMQVAQGQGSDSVLDTESWR